MVYVEFFDKAPVKNICSCLAGTPERVYLLGYNEKQLQRHAQRYHRVFMERGSRIDFVPTLIPEYSLSALVKVISTIVNNEKECSFDLTGGDELALVAMGIASERFKSRGIQMHKFNHGSNMIVDCDGDGKLNMQTHTPALSVKENIQLLGGEVVFEDGQRGGTPNWKMTESFKQDIRATWDICRRARGNSWNKAISVLSNANKFSNESSCQVVAPMKEIKPFLKRLTKEQGQSIFQELGKNKLAKIKQNGSSFCVSYKSPQLKRLLSTPGLALEMICYLYALEARTKGGKRVYNDALNGVYINWNEDGSSKSLGKGKTSNEIDVIMMHGMIPVFVSCKNGKIDREELYKLSSVALKFGRDRSKKVLVITSLGNDPYSNCVRQRARDMKITLIEPQKISEEKFKRLIGNAWRI